LEGLVDVLGVEKLETMRKKEETVRKDVNHVNCCLFI